MCIKCIIQTSFLFCGSRSKSGTWTLHRAVTWWWSSVLWQSCVCSKSYRDVFGFVIFCRFLPFMPSPSQCKKLRMMLRSTVVPSGGFLQVFFCCYALTNAAFVSLEKLDNQTDWFVGPVNSCVMNLQKNKEHIDVGTAQMMCFSFPVALHCFLPNAAKMP